MIDILPSGKRVVKLRLRTVAIIKAAREAGYISILEWLAEQDIHVDNGWLLFDNEEDALAFSLKYGP